jgi:hypothetical protein
VFQVRYAQSQMEKLRKTNIFNATFHINGFRWGSLQRFENKKILSSTMKNDQAYYNAGVGISMLAENFSERFFSLILDELIERSFQ